MEETAQEASTTPAPEAPAALTPDEEEAKPEATPEREVKTSRGPILPVHPTYALGMVPALRWQCACGAVNLNLDPRAVKAGQGRRTIEDKCPQCGAVAYARPQLIIEKVPAGTLGKVTLK